MKAHHRRRDVEKQLQHRRMTDKCLVDLATNPVAYCHSGQNGDVVVAQSASRRASRRGGAWQNRLTLNGRSVSWRVATIIASARATVEAPSPSEPSAPALPRQPARGGDARHRGLNQG